MFLLALHIVSISILVAIVWMIAFKRGVQQTERRIHRKLEQLGIELPQPNA